jgi:hypothetical protein
MNDGSVLNNSLYYSNNDLIINNSNSLKEILFKTSYINLNNNFNVQTKIDFIGKLQIYHTYNILQPTFISGYYDVEGEIFALKQDGVLTDIQLTGIEAAIIVINNTTGDLTSALNLLETQVNTIGNSILTQNTYEELQSVVSSANLPSISGSYGNIIQNINSTASGLYSTSFVQGAVFSAAIGLSGGLLAWIGSSIFYVYASNALITNSNITNAQKKSLYESQSNTQINNYSNFNITMSNLNLTNGFINSNILTPQSIPSINTNTITYNGVEISTTLNNYLLKAGGTMSGRINFNYGANVGIPVAGGGGSGERVVLNTNGITGSDYPSAVGVSLNSLWFSAPNNSNYQWYVNGVERMSLSSTGILNTNTLQQGGVNITNISSNITLTQTPNLQKKYMFTGTCSSSMLMPDGITYFAYDIDLRNYTQLKYAPNPNTPYRIFKIKVFFGSVYFGYLTNGKPNVISYEVYMSNESQGGGGGIGSAGLNVCAIGYPENVILNTISPTQLSLVCGDFNFLTVLSRVNGTVFNAIIEDCLF